MDTIIYLIKHADEFEENGIKNTDESTQIMNEKFILSVNGEQQAKKLSENDELQNIDVLWSSSYARAKGTAKYITDKNSIKMKYKSIFEQNEKFIEIIKQIIWNYYDNKPLNYRIKDIDVIYYDKNNLSKNLLYLCLFLCTIKATFSISRFLT